jgi:hypothetical protein
MTLLYFTFIKHILFRPSCRPYTTMEWISYGVYPRVPHYLVGRNWNKKYYMHDSEVTQGRIWLIHSDEDMSGDREDT